MPVQELADNQAATRNKSNRNGRTRIPPNTLPADFDFGDQHATGSAPAASAAEPPKTLPANFDFDAGTAPAATSAAAAPAGPLLLMSKGREKPPWMAAEPPTTESVEFNRKQGIVEDWLAIKRELAATDSKIQIPDLPSDMQAFARQAGYPEFQPGYGSITAPGEEPSAGIVERVRNKMTRKGSLAGGAIGERLATTGFGPELSNEQKEALHKKYPRLYQFWLDSGAVGRAAGKLVGGMVSDPLNWMIAGGAASLPKLGQRLVALGFAGQMGAGVYHKSGELGAIWDRSDIPQDKKVEMITDIILNTAMATAAGKHATRPGLKAEIDMLGEMRKLGPDAVSHVNDSIQRRLSLKEKLQSGVQHMAGTGPRLAEKVTEKAVKATAAENAAELERGTKAEAKQAEAQAGYDTKISRINEDYDAKIADVRKQYAEDVAARDKKVSELEAKHADETAAARREWVEQTHAARETERAQAKVEGRREALRSQQKAYTGLIRENVKAAHTNVRGALDERWNQLRETVGTETPVSPSGIYDSVEQSRAMLSGVPADLKVFNDVFKQITEPDTFKETPEGPKPAPREYISFDDARTQYSAVGEKAYAAEGNLRRALFNVYDAYDKALSKTAADAGAAKPYADLKRDWSRYMKDWHDMSSMSTGGSPLARLYRATDNPVVEANVTGKFGDRLFGTFARYDKYGANPSLMPKLRNSVQELSTLPRPKVSKAPSGPGKFEAPTLPKLPEPVESPEAKVGALEGERAKRISRTDKPDPVKPPDIKSAPMLADMVGTVRRAKIEKAKDFVAGQKWHTYDAIMATWAAFGIPDAFIESAIPRATLHAAMYLGTRFGWMKFVRSPMGMEWMTKVTPADIATISKTLAKYPSERIEAGQAIAMTLEDAVRNGAPAPNISKFSTILTPEQQREVMKTVKDINDLKALGIKPPDVTARGTRSGSERPPLPQPSVEPLAGFSGLVINNQHSVPAKYRLGNKVLISAVYDDLVKNDVLPLGMTIDQFKRLLLEANTKRFINLSRADLLPIFAEQNKIPFSEIERGHIKTPSGADFHFIDIPAVGPQSSTEAGGSGTAAGAAADNADISQARKNLGLSPGQWDNRLLSEAQRLKDVRLAESQSQQEQVHGGHAGGGVSSAEELNRPGIHYVISKSGQLSYYGKSFAPESLPPGSTHVTVLPNGDIRVNAGPALSPLQERIMRDATRQ